MDNGDGTYTSYKNLPAVTVKAGDLLSPETLAAMAAEGNVAVETYTPDPQELDAHYQPAVTVKAGDLVSAETLAAMAPEGNVAVAAYTPDPQELDAYYQQLRGAV